MERAKRRTAQFTAENIVGILRAITRSDGSYADICQKAKEHGVSLHPYTVSYWVNRGRADIRNGYRTTGHAGFAAEYDRRVGETRGTETDRTREVNRALAELDSQCACGNERAKKPDGSFDEACPACLEQDRRGR